MSAILFRLKCSDANCIEALNSKQGARFIVKVLEEGDRPWAQAQSEKNARIASLPFRSEAMLNPS